MTFLEFAARGKNAWWRYILATMLAMVIAAVLGTAIVVVLKLSGRFFRPDLGYQILLSRTRATVAFSSMACA